MEEINKSVKKYGIDEIEKKGNTEIKNKVDTEKNIIKKRKKTTIKDIAEYVGVSPMTVSFVINKNPNQKISEATTQKILKAVKELNYIPNSAAKTLRGSESKSIGVCIAKTALSRRYVEVIEGIRRELTNNGYTLLLCSNETTKNSIPKYLSYYFEGKVDGVIYLGRDGIDVDSNDIEIVVNNNIPFVTLDCYNMSDKIAKVNYDYYSGTLEAVGKLVDNFKYINKIIYIKPEYKIFQEKERLRAINQIVNNSDIELFVYDVPIFLDNENSIEKIIMDYNWSIEKSIDDIFLKNSINKNTLVISSWGDWTEIIYAKVINNKYNAKVLSLAEGTLNINFWDDIYYSNLPNYQAGEECAKIIISMKKNEKYIKNKIFTPVFFDKK